MYDDKSLEILEYHRSILLDKVRTESFLRAILKTVKLVLDMGCGTGILSYYACMAGARRVYAVEQGIWFIGKDMDIVGEYRWSDTDTIAVSFDTRWEVLYEHMINEYLAGEEHPMTLLYLGMNASMVLADGTEVFTVDIMNDGMVGVEAISPAALPFIPEEIVSLVEQRREEMINGTWDPFTAHSFVSNGTGLELGGTSIPPAGTEVKPAGEEPTDVWLLTMFNFDLQGVEILE